MKKLLPLMAVGILVLGGLGAGAGTDSSEEFIMPDSVVFSRPVVYEKENLISIELTEANSNSMETGKPMLPVVSKVYTFEFGTSIDNVEVTFSDVIEQEVTKLIMPAPEKLPVSINSINKANKQEKVVSYSDIDIYPENRFSYSAGAGIKDGKHVVYLSVSLNPVQYKPSENKIYYSENAFINIEYTPPANPVTFPDDYDLLIITAPEFESALQPLVDHKNGLDPPVRTIMVTLDDIPAAGGTDEQEDIKLYIKDAIETWGITYVILAGAGVKEAEIFPVRYAYIPSQPHEDSFPSDLYYADIYNETGVFQDWDYDGDEKYAEFPTDIPNMDVHPDVYLARLPIAEASEATTIVDKIIDYKAHNKMMKKIMQLGGDTFTGNSQMEGEYANTVVMTKLPGYSTTELWGSNGKLTKSNVAKGFKSGVDFVDFSGHGSWASWATHPPNDEDTWIPPPTLISNYHGWLYIDFDFYMVNNAKKLPVVVINACSTNKFTESPNCLGWKTLSKSGGGGIAAFGASGIGYGSPGQETSSAMGWMEVKSFEELYNTKVLGEVLANCVTSYYNTFEGTFDFVDYKTMLEFSMFGDPTLAIQDGDDPRSVPVNRPVFHGVLEGLIDSFPQLARLFELILAKIN